tara:strand:- start:385 stop:486 length:102 start_codon:yes stop_codon:yes gene_type:complete
MIEKEKKDEYNTNNVDFLNFARNSARNSKEFFK